jgi:hypothetical protein
MVTDADKVSIQQGCHHQGSNPCATAFDRRNSRSFPARRFTVWPSGHSLRLAWTEMTKRASTANGRVFMYLTDRREPVAFGSA